MRDQSTTAPAHAVCGEHVDDWQSDCSACRSAQAQRDHHFESVQICNGVYWCTLHKRPYVDCKETVEFHWTVPDIEDAAWNARRIALSTVLKDAARTLFAHTGSVSRIEMRIEPDITLVLTRSCAPVKNTH